MDSADSRTSVSVELLYFAGCPNHEELLPHLHDLIEDANVDAAIELVEITDEAQARDHHFPGSPTVRVEGIDVDPAASEHHDYGMQCRLYRTHQGTSGTPPDEWIIGALISSSARATRKRPT